MRLRWILIWLLLVPTFGIRLASARMPVVPLGRPAELGETTIGIAASAELDSVVIAFFNRAHEPITEHFDAITVEMSSGTQMRVHEITGGVDTILPNQSHFETVSLEPLRQGLAPGDYTITVTWRDQRAETSFKIEPPPDVIIQDSIPEPAPSKWPYVLAVVALLALLGLRAGTDDKRMPCSHL